MSCIKLTSMTAPEIDTAVKKSVWLADQYALAPAAT
jgi:hypothetical protein